MKTWMTAVEKPAVPNIPGRLCKFENVANVAGLNVGDTVSVRGPMFLVSGTPTVVCAKVLKR